MIVGLKKRYGKIEMVQMGGTDEIESDYEIGITQGTRMLLLLGQCGSFTEKEFSMCGHNGSRATDFIFRFIIALLVPQKVFQKREILYFNHMRC